MVDFRKNALYPRMHRSNTLHPKGEISNQDAFFCKFCILLNKNVVRI